MFFLFSAHLKQLDTFESIHTDYLIQSERRSELGNFHNEIKRIKECHKILPDFNLGAYFSAEWKQLLRAEKNFEPWNKYGLRSYSDLQSKNHCPYVRCLALLRIGQIYNKPEEKIKYLNAALELAQEIHADTVVYLSLIELGKFSLQRGFEYRNEFRIKIRELSSIPRFKELCAQALTALGISYNEDLTDIQFGRCKL